ncbi:hypothetical protein [Tortoise microvirus 43]|nr:hypothetical protein [Tortoise microvirus 43]
MGPGPLGAEGLEVHGATGMTIKAPEVVVKTEKARVKGAKASHDLHVLLLMRTHGLSKSEAIVLAYLDGYDGVDKRMGMDYGGEPELPLKPVAKA